MSESHTTPDAQVLELLAAAAAALDVTGLDRDGLVRRMVEVRVRLDGIAAAAAVDARHPDLPPMAPRAMADAVAALRAPGGAR